MIPKERVRFALTHQSIDRFPTQINYTPRFGKILSAYFKVSVEQLPDFLGNHLLRVDLHDQKRKSADGKIIFDWWGVGFDAAEEGYFTVVHPLANTKTLDAFLWPDPHDSDLLTSAAAAIQSDEGRHFVCPNFGFALFERAWSLRGFDAFLMDLVLNPSFAEDLLERITEIQLALIKRFIALGVDCGYFGDDYGAQQNMLFSPKIWRSMFKPRLARLFAAFRDAGLPVILHSDGQIGPILPDLVEIGLTALNPVQPEVIDHTWLRATFGSRLACYGGISTQTVLPSGTPRDVKQAVRQCVADLAPAGTGLLLAPSHRMMTDIPLENIAALLESFAEL